MRIVSVEVELLFFTLRPSAQRRLDNILYRCGGHSGSPGLKTQANMGGGCRLPRVLRVFAV